MKAFVDSQGLFNSPQTPNCVQWSPEGLLAVAAGNAISLLHPGHLDGPRAFVGLDEPCDVTALDAPGEPRDHNDVHFELANLQRLAYTTKYHLVQMDLSARSLAWSPLGCSVHGGCLLAVATNDSRVMVYGPPQGLKSEWRRVGVLSEELLEHLQATEFKGVDPPEPAAATGAGEGGEETAAGADDVLRLRGGGGSGKRKRTEGAAAAAAHAAEGPEEGGGAAAAAAGGDSAAYAGYGTEPEAKAVKNAQAGDKGAQAGDKGAQAGDKGAQAGGEAGPSPAPAATPTAAGVSSNCEGGATTAAALQQQQLAPGARKPGGRKGQARKAPAGDGDAVDTAAGDAGADGPSPQPKPATKRKKKQEQGEGEEAGAEGGAGASGSKKKASGSGGGSKKGKERGVAQAPYQVPQGFSAADLPAVESNELGVPTKAGFLNAAVRRFLQLRRQMPAVDLPIYESSSTHLIGADVSLTVRVHAEFEAAYGEALPAAKLPPTAFGSEFRRRLREVWNRATGEAKAAFREDAGPPPAQGAAAAAAAGDCSDGRVAGRSAAGAAAAAAGLDDEGSGGETESEEWGEGSSDEEDEEGGEGGKRKHDGKSRARGDGYKVPEGFSAADLPAVNLGGKKAKLKLLNAAVLRFLLLRKEMPAEQLPTYESSGGMLKRADIALVRRVVAEFEAAYGPILVALRLVPAKCFRAGINKRLRLLWDRTTGALKEGFSLGVDGGLPVEAATPLQPKLTGKPPAGKAAVSVGPATGEAARAGAEAAALEGGPDGEVPDAGATRDAAAVPKQEGKEQAEDGSEAVEEREASAPSGKTLGGKKAGRGSAARMERYEVPEGFNWMQLPSVDTSTPAAARKGLLMAAIRRFLALRAEASPEELPGYESTSTHLHGLDAQLVERVTQEFLVAHSALMEQLQLGPKFQMMWMQAMRKKWNRVTGAIDQDVDPRAQQEARVEAGFGVGLQGEASPSLSKKKTRVATSGSALSLGEGGEEGQGAQPRQRWQMPSIPVQEGAIGVAGRVRRGQTYTSGPTSTLPSAAYQARLLCASTLCVAWSPLCRAPGSAHWCMLAAGSKSGHIWLWRYTPSQRAAPSGGYSLVGCCRGALSTWISCLSWVGLPGPQGGCLALAAGGTDGGVSLWGASVEQLAQLAPLPSSLDSAEVAAAEGAPWLRQYSALERWGTPCTPDLRTITSLAATISLGAAPGACTLLVAAGKSAGTLVVWQSEELSFPSQQEVAVAAIPAAAKPASPSKTASGRRQRGPSGGSEGGATAAATTPDATSYYRSALQGGSTARPAGQLGVHTITGLAWAAPAAPAPPHPGPNGHTPAATAANAGAAAAEVPPLPLLCSSFRDGALRCWQLRRRPAGTSAAGAAQFGAAQLQELPLPQPCSRRRKSEAGHGVLGLAASPSGLFVASVVRKFSDASEFKKTTMTHDRVIQSFVHLDRLWGPGAPLPADAAATACAARLLEQTPAGKAGPGVGSPGAVWDLSQLLALPRWHAEPEAPAQAQQQQHAEQAAQQQQGDDGKEGEGMDIDSQPGGGGEGARQQHEVVHAAARGPAGQGATPCAATQAAAAVAAIAAGAQRLGAGTPVPSELAVRITSQLEAPFLAALVRASSSGGGLGSIPQPAWRALQLATALRHVLAPYRSQELRQPPVTKLAPLRSAPAATRPVAVGIGWTARQAYIDAAAALAAARQQQQLLLQHQEGAGGEGGGADGGQGHPATPQQQQQQQEEPRDGWAEAIERNEMHLLQRHILHSLSAYLAAGPGPSASPRPVAREGPQAGVDAVSALLMADWALANLQAVHPEVYEHAARVYLHAGEESLPNPLQLPPREHSALLGADVALSGQGVVAATSAEVEDQGTSIPIARCPATLRLVECARPWACRACNRRYPPPASQPPAPPSVQQQQQQDEEHGLTEGGMGQQSPGGSSRAGESRGTALSWPLCVFCGIAVGPTAPAVQLLMPCAL